MKKHVKNPSLLILLLALLGSLLVCQASGQTFTTLYNFTASETGAGGGWSPFAGLILSGNTLYGTTDSGGGYQDDGTVFRINTNGTGFRGLYSFSGALSSGFSGGKDGDEPFCSLVVSGNTLYGTTSDQGGGGIYGKVFALNTDGTGFKILHSFGASDGALPLAGLILSGNTLYGTTFYGGTSGNGTVFQVNTDGTAFTSLYSFTGGSDGANPRALTLGGNTLYGAAQNGGDADGDGTVFAVNTDGTGFNILHSFTGGSDGSDPVGRLVLSGNTLYGTADYGGGFGNGTVFAINTDGTGFTVLHSFTATSVGTNSDGAVPGINDLVLSGNTLYGTASGGGGSGGGTVFMVNTDGTGFTTLHDFAASPDIIPPPYPTNIGGSGPVGLMLSGNMLYGMANTAGAFGGGTVFSISLPLPQLAIIQSGTNVVLSWPMNAAGFTLESTTNLAPPAVWNTNSSTPVIISGQNVVTNTISGKQMFYRLSQ